MAAKQPRPPESVGLVNSAIDEIAKYYLGNRDTLMKVMAAAVAGGHVLLEDNPGTGKTFVAKLVANVLGLSYRRIQFTPDLLPSDIIGTKVWRPAKGNFELIKGPIFSNLILADEINRAPPKTQSALLEAMEEGQVTVEGDTIKLPQPFLVIATQNPIEYEGTYPLPEAQLDRFMLRLSLGYPDDEVALLKRRISWKSPDPTSEAQSIMDAAKLSDIRDEVENDITVSDDILEYISQFNACRKDDRILAGPSPRGLLLLMHASRAMALLNERSYVIPDDVKFIAADTLAHRLVLKPEFALEQANPRAIIEEYIDKIPVPK